MNDIVVGVRPIKGSVVSELGDDSAPGSIGAMWVIIDGREIPVDGHSGLISAHATMDAGPVTVELKLVCRFFQTVDYREKEKYLHIDVWWEAPR